MPQNDSGEIDCTKLKKPSLKDLSVPEYIRMKKVIAGCMNWCESKGNIQRFVKIPKDYNQSLNNSASLNDSEEDSASNFCEWVDVSKFL